MRIVKGMGAGEHETGDSHYEVSYISPNIVGTDAGSKGTFEERKVVGPISLFGIIREIQEIQKFQDMIQRDWVPDTGTYVD